MIKKEPLVSIITPCFNEELNIHRFLNSILNQTYSNIELIVVNDGSTDNSEKVILSYNEKFKNKGVSFIYIYQENKGLAGAINSGLKKVTGEYLCWPDSDDYLEPESIEKRVNVLERNSEYAVVTSNAFIRDINNLENSIGFIATNKTEAHFENQFELLLNEKSIFCPITHMVRMSSFIDAHPSGQIYPCRRGQNWQMLLPLYYKYKRIFLDEPLCNYIVYSTSMSQGDNTQEKKLFRAQEHEDIIINTLQNIVMSSDEKEKYIYEISIRYSRKRIEIAFQYKNKELFKEQYLYLLKENRANWKDKLKFLIINNSPLYSLYEVLLITKRFFK